MSRSTVPAVKALAAKPKTGDPPAARQQTQLSWQMCLLEDLLTNGNGDPPQARQQTQLSWQMCLLEDLIEYGPPVVITLIVAVKYLT